MISICAVAFNFARGRVRLPQSIHAQFALQEIRESPEFTGGQRSGRRSWNVLLQPVDNPEPTPRHQLRIR
jgi:hypothetical protein